MGVIHFAISFGSRMPVRIGIPAFGAIPDAWLPLSCWATVEPSLQGDSSTMRATDAVHLGLMLSAIAVTYLVPFELLLLSYVVLGPAHYFTEISWLHDRKYFLPHRSVPIVLAFVAVIAALIDHASWFGFVMWSAFVVCALFAAASAAQGSVVFMIAIALTAVMYASGSSLAVLGILLPT